MEREYEQAYADLYKGHWWWRVREHIILRTLDRILVHTPRASILDVGCGAGLFFGALQKYGQVTGVETNPDAVEQSGAWRSQIVLGELDDSFHPANPFDLILFLDVLEHTPDPVVLLRRAAGMLTPAGRVLITVPAFNVLWTSHDDLNRHVRRYSARDMRETIRTAGLVPQEAGYLFQSLVILKLLVRLREALMPRPPHVPRIPTQALNRAAMAWYKTEHALLSWVPFGGTLMVLATRSN